MGLAEIIPGVSGGTIALILGIYEDLITSISKVDSYFFKQLFQRNFRQAWKYLDGPFLLKLFLGMICGILSLSSLIVLLIELYPFFLKGFFSLLLLGSLFIEPLKLTRFNIRTSLGLLSSFLIAYILFNIPTLHFSDINSLYIFFGGLIAICAFILPGISGSFILLLLGLYPFMMNALNEFNYVALSVFFSGCLVGLLLFVRILKKLYVDKKEFLEGLFPGLVFLSIPLIWKTDFDFFYSGQGSEYISQVFFGMLFGVSIIIFLNKLRDF